MGKNKGNPDNLQPLSPKGDEPLTKQISFRVTESVYNEVKQKDDPSQFCRDAVTEKLDREKSN